MPRPREYDDGFRTRVIDAAGHLLATEGPHALSVRRVAEAVDGSTGAIYRLVGSKDDLVRAMFVDGFARLGEALAAVPAGLDPLDRLEALGHAYLDVALADPSLYSVMFERPVPEFCPGDADRLDALGTLQVLIDAVDAAIGAGALPQPADAGPDIAVRLWVLAHGIASLTIADMLGTDAAGAHAHLATGTADLLRGLGATVRSS